MLEPGYGEYGGLDRITAFLEGMKTEETRAGGDALADHFINELKTVPDWFKSCVFHLGNGADEDARDFSRINCGSSDKLIVAVPRDPDMTDIESEWGSPRRERAYSVGAIKTIGIVGARDNRVALKVEPYRVTPIPPPQADWFVLRPEDIISVGLSQEVPSYLNEQQKAIVAHFGE